MPNGTRPQGGQSGGLPTGLPSRRLRPQPHLVLLPPPRCLCNLLCLTHVASILCKSSLLFLSMCSSYAICVIVPAQTMPVLVCDDAHTNTLNIYLPCLFLLEILLQIYNLRHRRFRTHPTPVRLNSQLVSSGLAPSRLRQFPQLKA
jgi:hypothetical protein